MHSHYIGVLGQQALSRRAADVGVGLVVVNDQFDLRATQRLNTASGVDIVHCQGCRVHVENALVSV